jgi:ferredoxin-NADP reductase
VPGQHYEIRLTSEDGYQAARLYSAASVAVGEKTLELTIALLPGGEVSPYMHEQARTGDQIELRGPLGKFFVWKADAPDPVLLIGGGSGVVPLRCMLQAHQLTGSRGPMRLVYSARSYDEIIYKSELLHNRSVAITLTGDAPADWLGGRGRVDTHLLSRELQALPTTPLCYICGATPFVEAMADMLLSLGVPPVRILTERFGATAPTVR